MKFNEMLTIVQKMDTSTKNLNIVIIVAILIIILLLVSTFFEKKR